jgi:hypothetical protein
MTGRPYGRALIRSRKHYMAMALGDSTGRVWGRGLRSFTLELNFEQLQRPFMIQVG